MGADGGIKITKISDIRKKWKDVIKNIIEGLEYDIEKNDYNSEYSLELLDKVKKLPKTIDNLSNEEICKILQIFESCDCPYLYEDNLITGEGDLVGDQMNMLSYALPGIYIETWT
jgi:hypothetical protein